MAEKVVLAYSGGLDTTVITHWLVKEGFDVYCVFIDLGQKTEAFDVIKQKAEDAGAKEVRFIDAKAEFVQDYVVPCVMMNAIYEGTYLLGTSMARPIIAKKQIEWAKQLGAKFVAHGATGKGNDQVRFEISYLALEPTISIIAPWKDPKFYKAYPGRKELIDYAEKHRLPVKATLDKPWSSDENVMHISFEAGMLEDPWQKPLEEMFLLSKSPKQAPDKATELSIEFERGVWKKVNTTSGSPLELLQYLNEIAGENGVGRVDIVESRFVGMKSRGVYETPGGTLLHIAHRAVESICLSRDVIDLKDSLMPRFAGLVYNGLWYTPQMKLLLELARSSQDRVSGEVRLEVYKGNVMVTGRRSEQSLYDFDIASMDKDLGQYRPEDAAGFIRLNALPFKIYKSKEKKS